MEIQYNFVWFTLRAKFASENLKLKGSLKSMHCKQSTIDMSNPPNQDKQPACSRKFRIKWITMYKYISFSLILIHCSLSRGRAKITTIVVIERETNYRFWEHSRKRTTPRKFLWHEKMAKRILYLYIGCFGWVSINLLNLLSDLKRFALLNSCPIGITT